MREEIEAVCYAVGYSVLCAAVFGVCVGVAIRVATYVVQR